MIVQAVRLYGATVRSPMSACTHWRAGMNGGATGQIATADGAWLGDAVQTHVEGGGMVQATNNLWWPVPITV
jgi:hypothetical protein